MARTVQITYSISDSGGSSITSGYGNEAGNAVVDYGPNGFAAATVNGAVAMAFSVAAVQSVWLWSDKGGTLKTNGTNIADVQTITITGTPTGGDFAVVFGGQATIIPFNASAATIQTALRAMSSIGSGNITCTGGSLPGTPVVCTFSGTLTPGRQALMVSFGNFTGGASPAVAITHTTAGLPSNIITLQPGIPDVYGISPGYSVNPFTVDVTSATFSCTPASRLRAFILTS